MRAAAAKQALVSGGIVLCILVNIVIPRFALGTDDAAVLSRILHSQSVLLQFLSFSSVPLKIIDGYVASSSMEDRKQGSSRNRDKNSENSSAAFSLLSASPKNAPVLRSHFIQHMAGNTEKAVAVQPYSAAVHLMIAGPAGPPGPLLAVVLLFLFLLPRSSLPEGFALFLSRGKRYPVCLASRVFLLRQEYA